MKRIIDKCNIQNIIVSLCFLAVCLGTQKMQTQAWNSGWIEFSRDAVGALLAIIILSHYKWKDFTKHRLPYVVWTVIGIMGMGIGIPIAIANRADYLVVDTIAIALGIFLMGYCVIHTVISFVKEKYRPQYYKPLVILWIVMLLWMIFSETEFLWPECYFVLFLCYYLTEQTTEQKKNVLAGMTNGMIMGFLAIQAHAFLCRPYESPRYVGNFCNPNHNCMFLCLCLVAILGKILLGVRENRSKWIQIILYLMAAVCYSFIFMTGSRSGYMTVFVVTVCFLLGYCRVKKRSVFVRMGILLVSLFLVMMPLTYLAVRYIPTIHPHVVFYFQEGYSEDRVHSWDPRDSEKYVSFEEMLDSVMWRFTATLSSFEFKRSGSVESYEEMRVVSTRDYIPRTILTAVNIDSSSETDLEQDPDKIPALSASEARNAFLVRYTIYKWYVDHLSLRGMPYDEQGFQLTENHWIQDTHNIYLDYGINFGWPVMIMFAVFIWWGIGRLTRLAWKLRDVEKFICLMVALVPPIFGMFEFAWGAGMLSTVAFYFIFKEMFQEKTGD